MNAYTKLSEKGQVVVPKAVRDRLGWRPGLDLEIVETDEGVTFRPHQGCKTLSAAQAVERFKAIYTHRGPPASLADMRRGAQEEANVRWQERRE